MTWLPQEAVAIGSHRQPPGLLRQWFSVVRTLRTWPIAAVRYNGEQALRAVVKAALVAAVDDWAAGDELPSGHGYADVAYLPRAGLGRPALLVELKWDQPVETAVDQVLNRDYPQVLRDLGVPILVVAVTYDAKTKEHACRIVEA